MTYPLPHELSEADWTRIHHTNHLRDEREWKHSLMAKGMHYIVRRVDPKIHDMIVDSYAKDIYEARSTAKAGLVGWCFEILDLFTERRVERLCGTKEVYEPANAR